MVAALLAMFSGLVTGHGWLSAAEAFERPAINHQAQRYARCAFLFFVTAATLLLTAAIVDGFPNGRGLSEILGGTGLICLEICVICGIRYGAVNQ